MPNLWLRILFFVALAVGLLSLAWTGSSDRQEEREERINASRRARETEAATQAFAADSPEPYPGMPATLPATSPSTTTQPSR